MVWISNSDIEKRLQKSYAARRKYEEESSTGGEGFYSGTETLRLENEKKPKKDERSLTRKITDFAGTAGKEIAKDVSGAYKRTGAGLAEVIADVSGTSEEMQKDWREEMDNASKGAIAAIKKMKDPKLSAEEKQRWQKVLDLNNERLKAAQEASQERSDEVIERTDPRRGGADIARIGTDIATFGIGAAARGATTGARIARGAGEGAALSGAASLPTQYAEDKDIELSDLLVDVGAGGILGGVGGKFSRNRPTAPPAVVDEVDEPITNTKYLLPSHEDSLRARLDEIDSELDTFRGGSSFTREADMTGDPVVRTGGRATNAGEPDMRVGLNQRAGKVAPERGGFDNNAEEARRLMRERKAVEHELNGLASIQKFDDAANPKLDISEPQTQRAVDNELQAIQETLPETPAKKVNQITDYFRSPPQVLKRIGLKDTADVVEKSFEGYRRELAKEHALIRGWMDRVPDEGASQRIFNFLDGDPINLTGQEAAVAREIRQHLEGWADRLNLPKEKRVTDYITHIFEGDFKGDSIDPGLSRILQDKPSGKVYNPFTEKRIGEKGYVEDVFRALDAYTRRSTRQVNMEPAMKLLADTSKNVDDRTARYLIRLNHRIAMKPTQVDEILNDVAATITGDRFGPNAGVRAAQAWRNNIYRATLGLNIGSAVRNLTQATNTFAELGTRDTLAGYTKLIRALGEKGGGFDSALYREMEDMGIFDNAIHQQDQVSTALRSTLKNVDEGLWAMFNTAEKINRGSAYLGAKGKALRKGMSEEAAQKYAQDVVGRTQFRFNDIETPLALRGQVTKTLTQFQSFNIRQADFLGDITKGALKGNPKEMAKVVRWIGANIGMAALLGNILGIKWWSSIPINPDFRGVESPTVKLGKGAWDIAQGKDEFGNEKPRGEIATDFATDLGIKNLIPGGTQGMKTAEGLEAVNQGASMTEGGRTRFPIQDTGRNQLQAGLFGQYSLPEAREYFDSGGKPLSDKQSQMLASVPDDQRDPYYGFFQSLQGKSTEKKALGKEIDTAVKDRNFERGRRLADEHNATIDEMVSALESQIGDLPDDLMKYINDTYRVNYTYYRNKNK